MIIDPPRTLRTVLALALLAALASAQDGGVPPPPAAVHPELAPVPDEAYLSRALNSSTTRLEVVGTFSGTFDVPDPAGLASGATGRGAFTCDDLDCPPPSAPRSRGAANDAQYNPAHHSDAPRSATHAHRGAPRADPGTGPIPISSTLWDFFCDAILPWHWESPTAIAALFTLMAVMIILGPHRVLHHVYLVITACTWCCQRTVLVPATQATQHIPPHARTPPDARPRSPSPSRVPALSLDALPHAPLPSPILHSPPPLPRAANGLYPLGAHGVGLPLVGATNSPLHASSQPALPAMAATRLGNSMAASLQSARASQLGTTPNAPIVLNPDPLPTFPSFDDPSVTSIEFATKLRMALKAYLHWRTLNPHDTNRGLRHAVAAAGLRADSLTGTAAAAIRMVTSQPFTEATLNDEHALMSLLESFANVRLVDARMRFSTLSSSFDRTMDSHKNYFFAFLGYMNEHILSVYTPEDLQDITCITLAIAFIRDKSISTNLATFTTILYGGSSAWRTATGVSHLKDTMDLWLAAAHLRVPGIDADYLANTFPLKPPKTPSSAPHGASTTGTSSPSGGAAATGTTGTRSTPSGTPRARTGHPTDPCCIHTPADAPSTSSPSKLHTNADCRLQQIPCPNHPSSSHTLGQCNHGHEAALALRKDDNKPPARASGSPAPPATAPTNTTNNNKRSRDPASRDQSSTVCFNCGNMGHYASACTAPPKEKRKPTSLRSMVASISTALAALTPSSMATAATAALATTVPTAHAAPAPFLAKYLAAIVTPSVSPTSLADFSHAPPTAPCSILGTPTTLHLDTCAAVSCLPSTFYDSLDPTLRPPIVPFPAGEAIGTAFGDMVPSDLLLGSVTLPVHIFAYISSSSAPLPEPYELCQEITFAVIRNSDSTTAPPLYVGGKALLNNSSELYFLFNRIINSSFTVQFPPQAGPIRSAVAPFSMASDATPLTTMPISPLPGDSDDFLPFGFYDNPPSYTSLSLDACALLRESQAPLHPALASEKAAFLHQHQLQLFGPFPSEKNYTLPFVSIPVRGPVVRRGLHQKFPAHLTQAINAEVTKWIQEDLWELCEPHDVRNVLILVPQEKGIDPATGLKKTGVRLTLDSSPLTAAFSDWAPGGHALPRLDLFYYYLRDCFLLYDLDFRSFYNTPFLTPESRTLFGLRAPDGRICRSKRPPQGFVASGSITNHLLWQHVISPLLLQWSKDTIPVSIPAFPPPGALPISPTSNTTRSATTDYDSKFPISWYVDNISGGIRLPPGTPAPAPGTPAHNDAATEMWRLRTAPLMLAASQAGFRFSPNSTYTTTSTSLNMGVMFTTGNALSLNSHRVQAIADFTRPSKITLHDVHSIRGLFLSFSRFCASIEFTNLVSLFTDIIVQCASNKTLASTLWNSTHDAALERLKVLVQESITLYIPDPSRPFYARCDANNPSDPDQPGGWAGLLYQYNADGKLCPVAIFSKAFTASQAAWHTKDKELGAIVMFLRLLQRHRLPCSDIVITTDHNNITYLTSAADHRTRTWLTELTMRNVYFQHIAGTEMRPNDALSRLPLLPAAAAPASSTPATPIVAAVPAMLAMPLEPTTTPLATSATSPAPPGTVPTPISATITASIAALLPSPPPMLTTPPFVTTISSTPVYIRSNLSKYIELQPLFSPSEIDFMTLHPDKFHHVLLPETAATHTRVWLHTSAAVIPAAASDLIATMLSDAHRTGCHALEKEMSTLLSHVWWPTRHKDIAAYVAACPQCQVADAPPRLSPLGYFNIKNPSAPHHTHIMDHMEMSPTSAAGHVAILTITCAFTRYVHLVPVTSHAAIDTLEAAMSVWHATGLPVCAQTDGATAFQGDFAAFLAMYHVEHKVTDAYAPWQNGKAERQHDYITRKLRKVMLGADHSRWHLALPLIAGVINSAVNRNTGASPYYLLHAHEKRTPAIAASDLAIHTGTIAEWRDAIEQVQQVLQIKNDLTSLQQAHVHAQRPAEPFTFTLNQDVLLFFPSRLEKLNTYWRPGYRVTDILPNDDTHVIVSRVEPDGILYDPQRVPVARLRPWDSSRAPHSGALLRITDGSLAVQSIVSHTYINQPPAPPVYEFTVSWSDPTVPHSTARLQDLMANCENILKPYCALHKIPYYKLINQRALMNKQLKVQAAPAARATLAAIFGDAPHHPTKPTHPWS